MFRLMKALGFMLLAAAASPGFPQKRPTPIRIEGATMATTYAVIYFDSAQRDFKDAIDSLLRMVNSGINNYDSNSTVSQFNRSHTGLSSGSLHFRKALEKSLIVARASDGHFDPTVLPLVNLWGFGPAKGDKPSATQVDSILRVVGFEHVTLTGKSIVKAQPGVAVDFGGIGQGYGVDAIVDFLNASGIRNYLVELGGEGYASGKNLATSNSWRVGILDPISPREEPELIGYAVVENESFTTSANSFNYRIIDGKRYGHTISPFTGFPIEQDLISVSVFAQECAVADAWATAFMVAGRERAIEYLKKNPDLGAILVTLRAGKPEYFISDNLREKVFLELTHDH